MTTLRALVSPLYRRYLSLTFWVRQQLRQPVLVSVRKNLDIRVLPAGQIARCLHAGAYEADQCRLVANFLQPGMKVIDIGANVGLYSLIADRCVRPAGNVWAIEPSKETHARLLDNLTINATRNVATANIALAAQEENDAILLRERGQMDGERYIARRESIPEGAEDIERVPVISLDLFCERNGVQHVDFIKMDIEGGEYAVLCGASRTLSANPGLVMMLEHTREGCARAGVSPGDILSLFRSYGFALYAWNAGKRIWDTDHGFILSEGNAWAAANVECLPRI